jgi:hypothetical protein
MKRLLENHPGELMVLVFVAMGIAFLMAAIVVEMLGGLGGVGYPGLIDGAGWQAGAFPPR